MSHEAVTWALAQEAPSMAKFVLVSLASHAGDEWSCWPSIKTIAKHINASERSVQRYLTELEDLGLVRRVKRESASGANLSSIYELNIDGFPVSITREGVRLSPSPDKQEGEGVRLTPGGDIPVTPPVTLLSPVKEPSLEPSRNIAAATPAQGHAHPLIEKVIAEVDHKHLDLSKAPNLLFGGATLTHWIEEGVDLEQTIIPAIAAQMRRHRGGPVHNWNYFRGAVFDAHRIRMEAAKSIDLGAINEPAFSSAAPARPAPQRRGPVPISDVFLQAEHRAREAERRRRGSVSDWSADESGGAHEGVSGGAALLTASGRV